MTARTIREIREDMTRLDAELEAKALEVHGLPQESLYRYARRNVAAAWLALGSLEEAQDAAVTA